MGKSFTNGEGGPSWSRGEDKRDVLRSLADLGEHMPTLNKPVVGYKAMEDLKAAIPDYSGNVPESHEKKVEVITESFDTSEFENYLNHAESFFRDYQKSLEIGRNYLNEADQKLYKSQVKLIEELRQASPDSPSRVNELKAQIDKILSTFSDLEKKIENYKKREAAKAIEVTKEIVDEKKPPTPANQNEFKTALPVVIDEIVPKDGDNNTEVAPPVVHNDEQMKQEIFTNPNVTLLDAVEANAGKKTEEPKAEDIIERADLSIGTSGTTTYNKSFDEDILKGSYNNEPQYKAEVSADFTKETPKTPSAEVSSESNVIDIAAQIAAKKAELASLEASLPAKSENDLGVDPVLFEKYLNEEVDKVDLVDPESKLPIKSASGMDIISGQENKINKELIKDVLEGNKKAPTIESKPLESISATKLRESNPGITDEQINIELNRRKESFKELLKSRKELKESFLPYYNSKNEFKQVYTNQIKGGYEVYKKTNWIGKMFGFNPQNLNSLASAERHKFADSRLVYKDKLESLFKGRIDKLNPLDKAFVSEDKMRAAMTDRFLIRPAKESLQMQNELFPTNERKNIISKYKEVLRNHPKASLSVGALMVGGTVASGGLIAALYPLMMGLSFATGANVLSTKFGVNKSERALDSTLKNAVLSSDADSLVAAEIKILSANQEVELAKNRRDVHTTLGGMVGGALAGPSTADYISNGSESALGKFYESIGLTSASAEGLENGISVDVSEVGSLSDNFDGMIEEHEPVGQEISTDAGDFSDPEEEEIFPPGYNGPETQMLYEVQTGDNFWNIMEGQTAAPQPPTMEWMKANQTEQNYQELIKLVENAVNNDSGLREMLGFGQTMDNLEVGSKVDLNLLDYLAKSFAESKGWVSNVEISAPEIPEAARNVISNTVKTYSV